MLLSHPRSLGAQQPKAKAKEQAADLRQAAELICDGKTVEALAAVQRDMAANPTSGPAANILDTLGATKDARVIFQKRIDAAPDASAKSGSATRAGHVVCF